MPTTNYSTCPHCHANWRPIEVQLQACESCLFIAKPLPETEPEIPETEQETSA